jgi:hypothetical protein
MGVYILYESKPGAKDSHEERARELAAITPGARIGNIDTTPPRPLPFPLDTLIFWGHGDQGQLCGKSAMELCRLIGEWQKLNLELKTVELITCNVRHCDGARDPYADRVKHHLKWDPRIQGTLKLKVKALPVNVGGKVNAWSILLAHPPTKSWVYITAPGITDADMMRAKNLIEFDRGLTGAISYTGDLAKKANKVVSSRASKPMDASGLPFQVKWTMNYGYFNTLRNHLVEVK